MTQRVVNYTYGTGNQVLPDGSKDVRDGIDNLQSFDIFMNADEDTYNQRDGDIVKTRAGAIKSLGFKPGSGDFTTGFTVMPGQRDYAWYDPVSKNWYSYLGAIPSPSGYPVAPSTNPVGDINWKPVTDSVLRNDLSSSLDGKGDAIITLKQPYPGAVERTQHDKNAEIVSISDFGAKGDGVTDDTVSINAALNSGAKYIFVPQGTFLISNNIYIKDDVTLFGGGWSSIIRGTGRDTHGVNNIVFDKCNGTGLTTALVIITGSNACVRDLCIDGNGLNNYYENGADRIFQDGSDINPTWRVGYSCLRIGDDVYPTNPVNTNTQYNVLVSSVKTIYGSWGGISVAGETRKRLNGAAIIEPFTNYLGINGLTIKDCEVEYCNSNNIPLIGVENFNVSDNRVISAAHTGIKLYRNWRNGIIKGNHLVYDAVRIVSWDYLHTVDYYRESNFAIRSEPIAVGHDGNTGVANNVVVADNIVHGAGKMMRGISVYSPSSGITISGNQVNGVVRSFLFGPVGKMTVTGNSFNAANYTYTDFNPGTQLAAQTVGQNTDGNIVSGQYTQSDIVFSGNRFDGVAVNLLRMNSWTGWNTIGIKCNLHFNGNAFATAFLADWAGLTKIAVSHNSLPAAGGTTIFKGNNYTGAAGYIDDYDLLFETSAVPSIYTDVFWKRVLTLNAGVTAGAEGTPRIIYDDNTGVCTLRGSIVGYTLGTTTAAITIPTRFRPITDNLNFIVDNNTVNPTIRTATVRITNSGSLYVPAATDSARFVSLNGISWPTRY